MNGFLGVDRDQHHHPARLGGRRVDQHVVGAEVGEPVLSSLEQRPHAFGIGHAVVGREHK